MCISAHEKIRTSTNLRSLPPQGSVSTNSTTCASLSDCKYSINTVDDLVKNDFILSIFEKNLKMKIVLLGYMASGKSSIGRKLSSKTGLTLIDLDDYIVEREKMTISNIFSKKGEIYFRKIEGIYLAEILNKKEDFILSLGGGTPCYGNNIQIINDANATSIYLQASVKKLAERLIAKKQKRPLVASLNDDQIFEFVGKHLFERTRFYEQAKISIKTDGKKKKEVVEEIYNLLF